MTFPSVVRSGVTPYSACAPPGCTRKPVITSSKTSSAPCRRRELAQPLEKPGLGEHDTHVAGHRLHDDGGDSSCSSKSRRDGVEVVEGRRERVLDGAGCDAGRIGQPERGDAGAGLDEQQVGVPVVAAGELHDLRHAP